MNRIPKVGDVVRLLAPHPWAGFIGVVKRTFTTATDTQAAIVAIELSDWQARKRAGVMRRSAGAVLCDGSNWEFVERRMTVEEVKAKLDELEARLEKLEYAIQRIEERLETLRDDVNVLWKGEA